PPLLKVMWKHALAIQGLYHIPCLEMVLACKLTTMFSQSRDYASKYLDAGDFLNIAQTNRDSIDVDRFRELAEIAAPVRSKKYLNYLREARTEGNIRVRCIK